MSDVKRVLTVILLCVMLAASVPAKGVKDDVIVANRDAGKYVALTFDDGPHDKYTPEILDILAEYNAKATFFVIGKNAETYPELVKREYDEGHEIGNHTYSHPAMNKISVERIVEEISKTQAVIESITGQKPVLFRSPGGYLNDDIIRTIESSECKPVLWSWRQDTKDWSRPPVSSVVKTVIDNLRDGDIILFHDYNQKGSPTPDALREILPELQKRGYSFVTVSELASLFEKDDSTTETDNRSGEEHSAR